MVSTIELVAASMTEMELRWCRVGEGRREGWEGRERYPHRAKQDCAQDGGEISVRGFGACPRRHCLFFAIKE
jgi:hypothetical protein